MTHVYILTIADGSDFGRTIHHSVWSTHAGAQSKANEVVEARVKWDTSGLGDTYIVDICQMEVRN